MTKAKKPKRKVQRTKNRQKPPLEPFLAREVFFLPLVLGLFTDFLDFCSLFNDISTRFEIMNTRGHKIEKAIAKTSESEYIWCCFNKSSWEDARVAEGSGLLNRRRSQAFRGFESLSSR